MDIPLGGAALVLKVEGKRTVRRRLLELGLLPGTELSVVRRAPMGDPVELRLRGYSLSIRGTEAAAIQVEPLGHEAPAGQTSSRVAIPAAE